MRAPKLRPGAVSRAGWMERSPERPERALYFVVFLRRRVLHREVTKHEGSYNGPHGNVSL